MLQKLKLFFISLSGIFFISVGFYFWASSSNLHFKKYNTTGSYAEQKALANDTSYSIITYNIGYLSGMTNNLPVEKPKSLYDKNLSKVIDELKKKDADILALQEIDYDSKRSYHMDQQKELATLGYNYYGQNINWDKKYVPFPYYPFSVHFGQIISGQSVLSKYQIVEQERIELKRNSKNPFYYDSFYIDRLAQVCKIKIDKKSLMVINVHLEAYDAETRKTQMDQVKKLYLKYYRDFPTILLGDFNSDLHFEDAGINTILELPDTGCAAFSPAISQNTFSSETPTQRLDYIFYNEHYIEELNAEILHQFGTASDHLPVLMKFKFKDQLYANIKQ